MRSHFVVLSASLVACATGPVEWQDAAPKQETQAPAAVAAAMVPRPAGQCPASVRTAVSNTGRHYAVWWSLRADQTADLVASSSPEGRSWSAPQRIDTVDAGRVGCARPAPAIAAEGSNVHVVYAMNAVEGPGFFLTHSMDDGVLFHSPTAVVYGNNPRLADIAAAGNFVIVAYEDPNTRPTRISIAVSEGMGHLFEYRQVVSPASGDVLAEPRVWTDGRRVTVSWKRTARDSSTTRVERTGLVR